MYVHNRFVVVTTSPVLKGFSDRLTSTTFFQLINAVHSSNVCVGNFDKQFIELAHSKKGFLHSINKQLVAVLEKSFFLLLKGLRDAPPSDM